MTRTTILLPIHVAQRVTEIQRDRRHLSIEELLAKKVQLYETVLIEIATRHCPDPATLAIESLKVNSNIARIKRSRA